MVLMNEYDDPWEWVMDDEIPFDIHDLEEMYDVIDFNNMHIEAQIIATKKFVEEKGIADILLEKGKVFEL